MKTRNAWTVGSTLCLCLTLSVAQGQGGWTTVLDPGNPINGFVSPGTYKGAAWVDVDDDGDVDLFAAPKFLFRNDGAGLFTALSTSIGSTTNQVYSGTSWADLDNDGDVDCINAQWPTTLYTNDGDGSSFTDQSGELDSLTNYASWGCAIGDMDGDAYLDYIYTHPANFLGAAPWKPCRLFQRTNTGLGGAVKLGYHITDQLAAYTVPFWSDFDLDGDMDLFVASGPVDVAGEDYCYRNMRIEWGADTLVRMTSELFASELQDGQCYNFIDVDLDGDLDLCLTNYQQAPTRMYRNDAGAYTPMTTPFTVIERALANNWGDFDNDGDLDVIISADMTGTRYYENQGNWSFQLIPGLSSGAGSCGVANGDYDNDGDLDVYVNGTNASRRLFRNDSLTAGRHWVNLRLQGVTSNRCAIGSIVRAFATINGTSTQLIREVNAQNSFQGQNDLRVHFGLGDATVIDSLTISWPSGYAQHIPNLSADAFYTVVEGSVPITSVAEPPRILGGLYPVPASAELRLELLGATAATLTIHDPAGRAIATHHVSSGQVSLDIDDLPSGKYVLEVQQDKRRESRSFIKQ